MPVGEQDVLGLDVAVHHVLDVGMSEGIGHFEGDLDRVLHRQLPLPVDPVPQRLTLHKGHDVVEQPVGLPRIVHAEDVRMLETGGEPDLTLEPVGADARGQFGMQHLDGDIPIVLDILGQKNGCHSSPAKLARDGVAIGQTGPQAIEHLGHGCSSTGSGIPRSIGVSQLPDQRHAPPDPGAHGDISGGKLVMRVEFPAMSTRRPVSSPDR